MSHWRLSVFRLSVTVCVHCVHDRLCTTRTRYLANHLWEFLLNLWLRCSLELVRHWGQRSRSRPTVESEVKVYCGVRGHGQGLLWGQRSMSRSTVGSRSRPTVGSRSRSTVGSEVKVEAYCGVRGQGQLWGQRSRSRPTVVKKHLFKNATFQQRQCVPVDAHCRKPSGCELLPVLLWHCVNRVLPVSWMLIILLLITWNQLLCY